MQSRVIVSGEPLLFNDVVERVQQAAASSTTSTVEGTIERIPDSGPSGTNAAMMLPVKHEGRVVGVVQVMTDGGTYSGSSSSSSRASSRRWPPPSAMRRLQKDRRRLEAAEAAARAAAAEWEQAAQVLDAVGDGIFLIDADGVVRLLEPRRRGGDGALVRRRPRPGARRAHARAGRRSSLRSRSPRSTAARAR